jgi:hypothetical protein
MTLLAEFEEFVQDHRSHGGITGDATPPAWNGYLLTAVAWRSSDGSRRRKPKRTSSA